MTSLVNRPQWQALQALAAQAPDLRERFALGASSPAWAHVSAPQLVADLSCQRIDPAILEALVQLAQAVGLEAQRSALFAGEPVNQTEGRAALHMALRTPEAHANDALGLPRAACEAAHEALAPMLAYADRVHADERITDVVNIGIGGSDLGPQTVVRALAAPGYNRKRFHFVSNVDPAVLLGVLAQCQPHRTLFIVSSKTFTTQETMANAKLALEWFSAEGGHDVAQHFVGVTTQAGAAKAFGIEQVFAFHDWVGGRYSLWGPIGLSIAVALGAAAFLELLAGAREMDEHFVRAPLARNLPVLLGLLEVWNRNFMGYSARSMAPYVQALSRLPAYLQQLEMESNGKGVSSDGQALPFATAPLVFGEPGTNGQHAFFQMLHQGAQVIPVEFITVTEVTSEASAALAAQVARQQRLLLANAAAQAQALAQGSASADPHRRCPGNRPSTTLRLQALTPRSLGALLALFEHRVFVAAAVWGINPFDQFGVELGKRLCAELMKGER